MRETATYPKLSVCPIIFGMLPEIRDLGRSLTCQFKFDIEAAVLRRGRQPHHARRMSSRILVGHSQSGSSYSVSQASKRIVSSQNPLDDGCTPVWSDEAQPRHRCEAGGKKLKDRAI